MENQLQDINQDVDTTMSLGQIARTLHGYRHVIALIVGISVLAYLIVAVAYYLFSPSYRTTSIPFRLEFQGASTGRFPNGTKFAPEEIVNNAVLAAVYAKNDLGRFTSRKDFGRGIYILETNLAYEGILADYRARLSDPKLTPADRDRIEKEFELRRASLSRADYSINWNRRGKERDVPESLVRKVLNDVLSEWARSAVEEKHILSYRIHLLAPELLRTSPIETTDPIIALHVLRSRIIRAQDDADTLAQLPTADVARTKDRLTLEDIRERLEEIVRFQVEPLIFAMKSPQPAKAIEFFSAQLAYDQRELQAHQQTASTIRDALSVYGMSRTNEQETATTAAKSAPKSPGAMGATPPNEAIMPQLSESFLDRLVSIAADSRDNEFRQTLASDYRIESTKAIPLQRAVEYDQQVLQSLKTGGTMPLDPNTSAQIEATRNEVRSLIEQMHEVFTLVSKVLVPETEIYTVTAPPSVRVERGVDVARLTLLGVLVLLVSIPLAIFSVLLHHQMRADGNGRTELAPRTV